MKPVYTSKYEATQHMKRHIQVTHETIPSFETRRWREPESNNKFPKQTGHQERIDKHNHEMNVLLAKKMFELATEDREKRTSEYAPGWRTGLSGTVIDCYPTAKKQVLNYKKFREDNRERDQRRLQKKLNNENEQFHQYLTDQRTSYSQKEQSKLYAKNRVLYRMYANRPHTALHLGIYDMAQKEILKERSKHLDSSMATGSAGSGSRELIGTLIKEQTNDDYNEDGGYDVEHIYGHSPSNDMNARTQPSSTAHNHEMLTTTERDKIIVNKIRKKLNEIQSVSDFINLSIDNNLDDYPTINTHPNNRDWNSATNDNLRNSESNINVIKHKIKPGYVKKRQFNTNYLSDVEQLTELFQQQEIEERGQRPTNDNMMNSSSKPPTLLNPANKRAIVSAGRIRPSSSKAGSQHAHQQVTSTESHDHGQFNLYDMHKSSPALLPSQRPRSSNHNVSVSDRRRQEKQELQEQYIASSRRPTVAVQQPPKQQQHVPPNIKEITPANHRSIRPSTAPAVRTKPQQLLMREVAGSSTAASNDGHNIVSSNTTREVITYHSDPLECIDIPAHLMNSNSNQHSQYTHDSHHHHYNSGGGDGSGDNMYNQFSGQVVYCDNNNNDDGYGYNEEPQRYQQQNQYQDQNCINYQLQQLHYFSSEGAQTAPPSSSSSPQQRAIDDLIVSSSSNMKRSVSSPTRSVTAPAALLASPPPLSHHYNDNSHNNQSSQQSEQPKKIVHSSSSRKSTSAIPTSTHSGGVSGSSGTSPMRKNVSFDDKVDSKVIVDYHAS